MFLIYFSYFFFFIYLSFIYVYIYFSFRMMRKDSCSWLYIPVPGRRKKKRQKTETKKGEGGIEKKSKVGDKNDHESESESESNRVGREETSVTSVALDMREVAGKGTTNGRRDVKRHQGSHGDVGDGMTPIRSRHRCWQHRRRWWWRQWRLGYCGALCWGKDGWSGTSRLDTGTERGKCERRKERIMDTSQK